MVVVSYGSIAASWVAVATAQTAILERSLVVVGA